MKKSLRRLVVGLSVAGALPAVAKPAPRAVPPAPWASRVNTILQAFHWHSSSNRDGDKSVPWYEVIDARARDIGNHFDAVWMPPPSRAAVEDKHGPTAQGYLPYRLLDLNSDYGTEAQLKLTLQNLNAAGVMPIADVVLNHIAPEPFIVNDGQPFRLDVAKHVSLDLDPTAIVRESGGLGGPDTGMRFPLVADVDHESTAAKSKYKRMLGVYRRAGFRGYRDDYLKGISPEVVAYYNKATKPEFAVGELWDDFHGADTHREQLLSYVERTGYTTSVFDFTTKAVLQKAVEEHDYSKLRDANGRAAGLLGIAPAYAVTFVDNHDTGSSPGGDGKGGQRHWEFPGDKVMQGYAYILTHPGIPTVYWPHYYDWKSPHLGFDMKFELDKLLEVRRVAGVHAKSPLRILAADHEKYAALIQGKNATLAMKIGKGAWQPPQGDRWTLVASGKDYVVWSSVKKTRDGRRVTIK